MKNLLEAFTEKYDIPEQTVIREPVIEMYGCHALRIEGHRGVESFAEEEILLRADKMKLKIKGSELRIDAMTASSILISGLIFELSCLF